MKMSRQARKLSQTGLYHIIFKGIGSQNIFEAPADYKKLREILVRVKEETEFELYAYCFMTNHVHLVIKEKEIGEISKIMTKILSHYATWFNRKYEREGALFANRYKSEPVEDERYYFSLIRYVHQNPLKAGMVESIRKYPHSSYSEYAKNEGDITDIDFLLDMLDADRKNAVKQFVELNEITDKETYEISESRRPGSAQIRRMIMSHTEGVEPGAIKAMPKEIRDKIIKELVQEKHLSKSALERALGISRATITRICEGKKQIPVRKNVPQFFD